MSETIEHIGVKRRSGRYPYGSGEDPYQSNEFLRKLDTMREKGLSEVEIAKNLGVNTTELRTKIAWANEEIKKAKIESVKKMASMGYSNTVIADKLGIAESSVRNYKKELTQPEKNKKAALEGVSNQLKELIKETPYLDVGVGSELQMGISRNKLKSAIAKLKEEGYVEHEIYVKRLTDPTKYTTVKVLTKEKDLEVVKKHSSEIRPPQGWTEDGGITWQNLKPIQNVSWDRVGIKYGDKGGVDKDGVIELRPGVKDLDLGNSKYAQVRIAVNGTHYLKGMAVYSPDLPKGIDMMFNTNKPSGTPKEEVLKKLKLDKPDNMFGATISRQKGALNIVNEEGDWTKWSSELSAQFLSKQPKKLIKERLSKTLDKINIDYEDISRITNPVVKKQLLEAYASDANSKSHHLKAMGMPKTRGHVILPIPKMKPNEVYAPNYKNGEKLVLVRYPHGGTFELPELTVNNKGTSSSFMKNAIDAIGIHPSVATKLSGADFDGDTVWAIPNNQKKIKTSRSLKELKDFDPNIYAVNRTTITPRNKQKQMGVVSNLITDMTIKGATQSEIASAVKHSMVVIDSEKHKLDWKQSAIDNNISALQKRYQTHISPTTGRKSVAASTLISLSKRQIYEGGTKEKIIDRKTGKTKTILVGAKKRYLVDTVSDAHLLSSKTAVEGLYADYINKLKVISNRTEKEAMAIKLPKRNKEAAKKYAVEVKSLETKLNVALSNAPKERQAQLQAANAYYKNLDYDMTKDEKKRLKNQVLVAARKKVGAKRTEVEITPKEWEAIQNNAISTDKLTKIIRNADMDKVRKLATPKSVKSMTTTKLDRAKGMIANGYTQAEVADALGVSVSTLRDNIEGE